MHAPPRCTIAYHYRAFYNLILNAVNTWKWHAHIWVQKMAIVFNTGSDSNYNNFKSKFNAHVPMHISCAAVSIEPTALPPHPQQHTKVSCF